MTTPTPTSTPPPSPAAHEFVPGAALGFGPGSVLHAAQVCRHCGIVRRQDGQNKPCRGKIRVSLR